jgi:hypothetical protein
MAVQVFPRRRLRQRKGFRRSFASLTPLTPRDPLDEEVFHGELVDLPGGLQEYQIGDQH